MIPFFSRQTYQHLNKVLISKLALEHNHKVLQNFHPEALVCPVLKSNAYGHGLTTVAPVFDQLGSPFLIVDSLYEAYELYKLKLKTPILILGYTHPQNFAVKKVPFHITVFDLQLATFLNDHQPGAKIHLFVDTGMSREGILLSELRPFLKELKKLKKLNVVGLASHFADSDNPRSEKYDDFQLKKFKEALQIMREEGFDPQWRHVSNSGGSFKVKDADVNMIRAGLASYGLNPLKPTDPYYKKLSLQPALQFTSILAQVKQIPKGTKVGYNCTFEAPKDMVIGLIPAGYYDGVDRRLSNKGFMKVGDVFCQVVGRVSMNMSVIDISKLKNPKVGDQVIIYSSDPKDKNSFTESAKVAGCIDYELLVHIAESVRREVI